MFEYIQRDIQVYFAELTQLLSHYNKLMDFKSTDKNLQPVEYQPNNFLNNAMNQSKSSIE